MTETDANVAVQQSNTDLAQPRKRCCSATFNEGFYAALQGVADGNIPDNWQDLETLCLNIIDASGQQVQALAVLIAQAVGQLHGDNAWLTWCKDTLGLTGNYLYHLHQVGRLLLGLLSDGGSVATQQYKRLFRLQYNRLIVLARLKDPKTLLDFLRANRAIENISREELRQAVDAWQGLAKPAKLQVALPGLDKFMAYVDRNEDKLEEIFTAAAATPEKAQMCVLTGFRLVAGALATYKQRPAEHLEELTQLHADLTEELADLERAIAAAHENL